MIVLRQARTYPIPALWKVRAEALSLLGQSEVVLHVLREAASQVQDGTKRGS
jgi:hypothetical protein